MPIVRVELFPGRSADTKADIARQITRTLHELAGVAPETTSVIFQETAPQDWFVAGRPYAAPRT